MMYIHIGFTKDRKKLEVLQILVLVLSLNYVKILFTSSLTAIKSHVIDTDMKLQIKIGVGQ